MRFLRIGIRIRLPKKAIPAGNETGSEFIAHFQLISFGEVNEIRCAKYAMRKYASLEGMKYVSLKYATRKYASLEEMKYASLKYAALKEMKLAGSFEIAYYSLRTGIRAGLS